MIATNITAKRIGEATGIRPTTKKVEGVFTGGAVTPADDVLNFFVRGDLHRVDLGQRVRIVAQGLAKSYNTGRMNPNLAALVRQATPYRLGMLLADIANAYTSDVPTVGHLADVWINENADVVRRALGVKESPACTIPPS